jgi:hypothetical protein
MTTSNPSISALEQESSARGKSTTHKAHKPSHMSQQFSLARGVRIEPIVIEHPFSMPPLVVSKEMLEAQQKAHAWHTQLRNPYLD